MALQSSLVRSAWQAETRFSVSHEEASQFSTEQGQFADVTMTQLGSAGMLQRPCCAHRVVYTDVHCAPRVGPLSHEASAVSWLSRSQPASRTESRAAIATSALTRGASGASAPRA